MRVMVKFRFPVESGNELLRSGKINNILERISNDLKPEAAYFYAENGQRAGLYVVNVEDSSQVLEISERLWFGLGGDVELVPVMGVEDIQKGLGALGSIIKRYGG